MIKEYYKKEENINVKVRFLLQIDDALSQFFGKSVFCPYITINHHNIVQEIDKAKLKDIIAKQNNISGYSVDDIKFKIETSEFLEIPIFNWAEVSYKKTLNKPMSKTLKKNS